ncbi:MAG: HlyD family efflux transporter periplasmic adaptor subunit [Planctomycetaceae bacterium]|jgi:multidrug efflux pump subunit AcrA (membrane-fusion protein)|nr:HlyD family efflux transporter periplasmic adaptor subunit [Planctomycetaceae bacterium]
MKTKNKILSVLLRPVISLVLLLLTGFIVGILMVPKTVSKNTESRSLVNTVEVVPLERHLDGIDFKIDGEVIPYRQLDIVPEIQGRVVYKSENCRLGRSVQAGEVLLRIDPTDYELESEQLTEAVKQAEVNIQENKVQLENTQKELELAKKQLELKQRDFKRNQSLAESNAVSASELDTAQSSLLTTEETVQKLENQIRIYETQTSKLDVALRKDNIALKTAKLNLERTEVKSPLGGVVTSDSFEVNTFIQRGASVAKILDVSQLEIQCSLYMKQIQWIWLSTESSPNLKIPDGYVFKPTPVTILYELEGTTWAWDGTLKTLDGGGMNAVTRMAPCRVKVDNPQAVRLYKSNSQNVPAVKSPPTLFFGMFVSIIVHSKPEVSLYKIPERALLPGNKIWTATGGKLHQHSIRVATTTSDGVLFYAESEHLLPTDLVVVSPLATPIEGGNVNIIHSVTKSVAVHLPAD